MNDYGNHVHMEKTHKNNIAKEKKLPKNYYNFFGFKLYFARNSSSKIETHFKNSL